MNITKQVVGEDKTSAWELRHEEGPFTGLKVPFGALCDFKPSPAVLKTKVGKFEPKAIPGVFLGYHLHPGGKWRGEYMVAPLREFNGVPFDQLVGKVSVHRIREVIFDPGKLEFPVREHYNAARRQIQGPVAQPQAALPPAPSDASGSAGDSAALPPSVTTKEPLPGFGEANKFLGDLHQRAYKGSKRPPVITSQDWVKLSQKERQKQHEWYQGELAKQAEQAKQDQDKKQGKVDPLAEEYPRVEVSAEEKAMVDSKALMKLSEPLRRLALDGAESFQPAQPASSSGDQAPAPGDEDDNPILDYAAVPCTAVPCMPTSKDRRFEHRFKIPDFEVPFNACVARPVGKKEIAQQPKAQAALDKEWDKLVKAKAWTEDKVREWKDVSTEAVRRGNKAHVGRVFELCVEKGSELRADDPARKYKGRSVFQGNDVKDETGMLPSSMSWVQPRPRCRQAKLLTHTGSCPETLSSNAMLNKHTSSLSWGVSLHGLGCQKNGDLQPGSSEECGTLLYLFG